MLYLFYYIDAFAFKFNFVFSFWSCDFSRLFWIILPNLDSLILIKYFHCGKTPSNISIYCHLFENLLLLLSFRFFPFIMFESEKSSCQKMFVWTCLSELWVFNRCNQVLSSIIDKGSFEILFNKIDQLNWQAKDHFCKEFVY